MGVKTGTCSRLRVITVAEKEVLLIFKGEKTDRKKADPPFTSCMSPRKMLPTTSMRISKEIKSINSLETQTKKGKLHRCALAQILIAATGINLS